MTKQRDREAPRKARESGDFTYYTGIKCRNGHLSDRYTASGMCIECCKKVHKGAYKKSANEWPAKYPQLALVSYARKRARKKGLEFSLTKEWALDRWTGCCEITGIKFEKGAAGGENFSASIDRKDSRKGYTPDNCRFIAKGINTWKGRRTDKQLVTLAYAIVEAHKAGKIITDDNT